MDSTETVHSIAHGEVAGSRARSGEHHMSVQESLLYLYVLVCPFYSFSIFFTRDTASMWLVLAMTVLLCVKTMINGGTFWTDRSFTYLLVFLGVYVAATLVLTLQESGVTFLGRSPHDRSATVTLRLLMVVVSFMVFANLLADASERVLLTVWKLQMWVGCGIALFGVFQYVGFTYFNSTAYSQIEPTNEAFAGAYFVSKIEGKRYFRAMSIFHEPSFFGFFVVPLVAKAAAAWTQKVYLGSRGCHAFVLVTFVVAIVANFSLTAILAVSMLGTIVAILLLKRNPRLALASIAGSGLFVSAVLMSPIGEGLGDRFGALMEFRDLSSLDRLFRVYSSTVVFLDHPLLGVGPGGYAFWYIPMGGIDRSFMASPLNLWLSVLTDVGIAGFAVFVTFLGNVLLRSWRAIRHHPLVSIYLWSVIAHLVLLTTLDVWYLDCVWFEFAMLLAVVAGWGLRTSREVSVQNA